MRRLLCILAMLFLLGTSALAQTRAVVLPVKGEIDDFTRDSIIKRFGEARAMGAKTIILELNTYGGLVTAALDISRFLKAQTDVHTIAFIDDKAISAGAMIAMACDEIVMTDDAVLGDCAPISVASGGGLVPLPSAERAKLESPILADFYDSAIKHGYNPLVAEAMVAVDRSVHWVEKQGVRRFVDDAEYAKLKSAGWQPVPGVPDPIDRSDTLLTVHAGLAQKIGIAKSLVASATQLAQQYSLSLAATLAPNPGEQFVGWLNSAPVRAILLVVFLQSLYLAFSMPGHGAPEAIATLSLGLLLGVPLLTGYAQWYEILAILVGLGLLAFEVFVFPGHMVSATAGILLMIAGFVMTFVPKEPSGLPGILPSLAGTYAAMERGLISVVAAGTVSIGLWVWLSRYLPKLPYLNRLVLSTVTGDIHTPNGTPTLQPAVGDVGVTITPLAPGGSVEFSASFGNSPTVICPVLSNSGFVSAGTRVVVQDISNNRILVRAVETQAHSI